MLLCATLTTCLVVVTLHTRRMGTEKREVARLGLLSGPVGSGTAGSSIP